MDNLKAKKNIVTVIALFFLLNLTYAQAPAIQWQKSLGGISGEQASSIRQTTDSGYIVAGYTVSTDGDVTNNHGSYANYWIVKLNKTGVITWQKSLGGTSNDYAQSIQQTTDGGYIVVGSSISNDGNVTGNHGGTEKGDYWIVKLDGTGNIQWQKTLGGTSDDIAYSVKQTSDGGYIVAGGSRSTNGDISGHHGNSNYYDYWIVKLTNTGTITWQKSYGGSYDDIAYSIQQTTDGGYIVAGYTDSYDGDRTSGWYGGSDYWILKLNDTGAIVWKKSYGGSETDRATSIQQTTEGGYIVAGYAYSNNGNVTGNHGNYDIWTVKLNDTGAISWQKSLGGTREDNANSIQQTIDGGYIVAGFSVSNDGDVSGHHSNTIDDDEWIVKLNNIGNITWQKSLGGSDDDKAFSVQQTKDGGYIIAGFSISNDGDVSNNHSGSDDYWIVKLGPDLVTSISEKMSKSAWQIYPNPTSGKFSILSNLVQSDKITIEVFNTIGERIISTSNSFIGFIDINLSNYSKGIYTVKISNSEGIWTNQVIVE